MKKLLVTIALAAAALAILLSLAAPAHALTGFPKDPKNVKIIDRHFMQLVSVAYAPASYFAFIYNKSGAGYIEVYEQDYKTGNDSPWRQLKKWKIRESCVANSSVKLGPRDIVTIDESGGDIFFSVIPEDGFMRPAGLSMNISSREFSVAERCHD